MKKLFASLAIMSQFSMAPAQVWAKGVEQLPEPVRMSMVGSTDEASKMNAFVSELMSRMTLEEKIGQLNLPSIGFDVTGPVVSQGVEEKIKKGLVGGVFNTYTPSAVRKLQQMAVEGTRLKIPMIFGYDVIHGHKTIFPIPLALACSWDPALVEKTAHAAAVEASADGLSWTFSPMVDISRDPRWGRVMEGSGEDPYLGSQLAKAMVRGYQGKDLADPHSVLACVKHFALYGAAEAGRDYNTVDMSRVRMYNEYLPPYKAAIDAGVATVMSSFNEIDGIPASGNKWLMTELLRNQWGFKGFVVTDYTALNEMIQHGVGDERKVCELALNAGTDMDMVGEIFLNYGAELVKSGKIPASQVDAACRRILEAKYKLGLFNDPYRGLSEERAKTEIMSAENLALSKEAAIKSVVLLKNANELLPLSATQGTGLATPDKKIAFIGPLVKDHRSLIGSWSGAGDWKKGTGLWDALETKFGTGKFLYAQGCNTVEDPKLMAKLNHEGAQLVTDPKTPEQLIAEAVSTAGHADVVVAVLGEPSAMSGEATSRSNPSMLKNQLALLKALKKTGKPIVLVLMNGRPLTLSWEDENVDAILETWFLGTMSGAAVVDLLFGDASPSGKLTMSFPRNVGQIPIYYNHKNTGRPFEEAEKYRSKYLDVSNEPLYPFGYGLNYTRFDYGDVTLSGSTLKHGESVTVSITVHNSGKRPGCETVQMYTRDLVGSITRPVKELKGFQRVDLKPGETKTVEFKITPDDLRFYDSDLKFKAEPGDFIVFVGSNSRDVKEASLKLID